MGELVRAWVDEIPEHDLAAHYAKAVADLDEHDLSMLAAWHASLEVGHPIANREFLVHVFPSLGDNRREALKIAAGFRGEGAFDAGVAEEEALDTVLPYLSRERSIELATECLDLYLWDRLRSGNITPASGSRTPAIASSLDRNMTAAMPSSAAAVQLASTSSTNTQRSGATPRRSHVSR